MRIIKSILHSMVLCMTISVSTFAQMDSTSNPITYVDSITNKYLEDNYERKVYNITRFNKGIVSDPLMLIEGRVPGVQIYNRGDNPNRQAYIRVRGPNTFDYRQSPLIIFDNIPNVDLSLIDPLEISSIKTLTSINATTAYGTLGASGTIDIINHRSIKEGWSIKYTSQLGQTSSSFKKINLSRAGFIKRGGFDLGSNIDWTDEVTRNAVSHAHNIGFGYGVKNHQINFGFTYRDVNGILLNSAYKNYNVRGTWTGNLLDNKWTIGAGVRYTRRAANMGFEESFLYALTQNPTAPVYAKDAPFTNNNVTFDGYYENFGLFDSYNPVALSNLNRHLRNTRGVLSNLHSEYRFTKKLSINLALANQYLDHSDVLYLSKKSLFGGFSFDDTKSGYAENIVSKANKSYMDSHLKWTAGTNKLSYEVKTGFMSQITANTSLEARNRGWPSGTYSLDNAVDEGKYFLDHIGLNFIDTRNGSAIRGYYITASMQWNNKLWFQSNLRGDRSSKLGSNKDFVPSLGLNLAYDFAAMENQGVLDRAIIRAGYGRTGQLPIDNDLSRMVTVNNINSRGEVFLISQQMENKELNEVVTQEFDLALDLSVSRVRMLVDYYNKTNQGIITERVIYNYFYNNVFENTSALNTNGVNMQCEVQVLKHANFSLESSAFFATNKTTFKEVADRYVGFVGGPGQGSTLTNGVVDRWAYGSIVAPKFKGVDNNGIVMYEDVNNDGTINLYYEPSNNTDIQKIANGLPTLEYGWSNTANYKSWSGEVFLKGAIGHSLVNTFRLFYEPYSVFTPVTNSVSTAKEVEGLRTSQYASHVIEKANYLSIENLSISKDLTIKMGNITYQMQVGLAAQNVITFTKYSGLNPEPVLINYGTNIKTSIIDRANNVGVLNAGVDQRIQYLPSRSIAMNVSINM